MFGFFFVISLVLRFFYEEIFIFISWKLYILNWIKSIFLGKENFIFKKKDFFYLLGMNS